VAVPAESKGEFTRSESIVMEQTNCRDIDVVREALRDMDGDVGAAVEFIIALRCARKGRSRANRCRPSR
jgi:hypothetical protein